MEKLLTKESLLPLIRNNMEKFDPVSLSNNGGWPSFENLEISLISSAQKGTEECYKVMLFYECVTGSSCFVADNRREQKLFHIYIKNGNIVRIH